MTYKADGFILSWVVDLEYFAHNHTSRRLMQEHQEARCARTVVEIRNAEVRSLVFTRCYQKLSLIFRSKHSRNADVRLTGP